MEDVEDISQYLRVLATTLNHERMISGLAETSTVESDLIATEISALPSKS